MAEIFAEKERRKRKPSLLPKISRSQAVHMPLATMAMAAKNMKTPAEQTLVGPGAVAVADRDVRMRGNLDVLRTSPADVSMRFSAMLERLSG